VAYTKQVWRNFPDRSTPVSAERLNHMEEGIAAAGSGAAFAPLNGKRAVGKDELTINVQDYGATGDGDPNKNNGTGDTAALQTAINAAAPSGNNRYGSTVFIPKGYSSYRYTQLTIPPGTRIVSNGAILQPVRSTAADAMGPSVIIAPATFPSDPGSGYGKYVRISNVTFSGSGDPYSYPRLVQSDTDPYSNERNRVGITIRTMIDVVFEHVYVDHFKIGIHMRDVYDSKFTDVQLMACGYSYDDNNSVTVTVTDTPVKVMGGIPGDGFMVYNTGGVRSFLGSDSNVSSTNATITQNAGTDDNWMANTDLWAVAAPGTTTTIRYELAGVNQFTTGFGYALWLDEYNDCTNANKFSDCHIESCPLFIRITSEGRQNNFVNCKFENRCPIADDMSSQSIIWFDDAMENTFSACLFTEDYTRQKPVIRADTPNFGTLNNYQGAQAATFANCTFFAARSASAMWFKGSFINGFGNIFNRTGGGLALAPFNLSQHCTFIGNRIVMADLNSKVWRITGTSNNIRDNDVIGPTGTSVGAYMQLDAGATNNLIDLGTLQGSFNSRLALAAGVDMSTNVVTHRARPYPSSNLTNNATTISVTLSDFLRVSYSTPVTVTALTNGYIGQQVTILSTNGNLTFQNNSSLITKSGGDTAAIAARGANRFQCIDVGVWKEI
jgi:hypothetical protein